MKITFLLLPQRMSAGQTEDPLRTSLVPRSLVMTPVGCFYCNSNYARYEMLTWMFGLKACPDHIHAAIRDLNAYLHEQKMVRIQDAVRHPDVGKFLISLMQLPAGFPVLRTSGEIQPGWKLNEGELHKDEFVRFYDGEWKLPVIWLSPDDDINKSIVKYTPIINFKLPGIYDQIKNNVPPDFLKAIDDTFTILIEGFYIEDFQEVERIRAHGGQEHYPNIPEAENVLYEGRIVQVIRVPAAPATVIQAKAQTEAAEDPTSHSCETK